MLYFKLKYDNGDFDIVKGKSALEVVKRYDLTSKKHVNTRIVQLAGEQEAIARADDEDESV